MVFLQKIKFKASKLPFIKNNNFSAYYQSINLFFGINIKDNMPSKLKNNKHYNSKETIVLTSRINSFFRPR